MARGAARLLHPMRDGRSALATRVVRALRRGEVVQQPATIEGFDGGRGKAAHAEWKPLQGRVRVFGLLKRQHRKACEAQLTGEKQADRSRPGDYDIIDQNEFLRRSSLSVTTSKTCSISPTVTVMKNGQVVDTGRVEDNDQGRMARHDHPRPMSARRDSGATRDGELRAGALTSKTNQDWPVSTQSRSSSRPNQTSQIGAFKTSAVRARRRPKPVKSGARR
jgi:hypothetical protein